MDIRVWFDAPCRECKCRPTISQMCGYLPHEGYSRSGFISQITQLFGHVRHCVEKRAPQRENMQVRSVKRGEERQCICHARMIGQSQKTRNRDTVRAEDTQITNVILDG